MAFSKWRIAMFKLTLRGTLLKLDGRSNTIALADAHNLRKIAAEFKTFNHIDKKRTELNLELIPVGIEPLTQKVLRIVQEAGIDPGKGVYKRPDKGYAIEWLFSVTHGFTCNFEELYRECLDWLALRYPTCPIAHAVIHYDEDYPHLHVVMIPIEGSQLPSSKILGYKGVSRERNEDLFRHVGHKYGFTCEGHLKGAAKRYASEMAIQACEKLDWHEFRERLWDTLIQSIKTRPEPFLHALKIPIETRRDNSPKS
jgi:hypothetical protein